MGVMTPIVVTVNTVRAGCDAGNAQSMYHAVGCGELHIVCDHAGNAWENALAGLQFTLDWVPGSCKWLYDDSLNTIPVADVGACDITPALVWKTSRPILAIYPSACCDENHVWWASATMSMWMNCGAPIGDGTYNCLFSHWAVKPSLEDGTLDPCGYSGWYWSRLGKFGTQRALCAALDNFVRGAGWDFRNVDDPTWEPWTATVT